MTQDPSLISRLCACVALLWSGTALALFIHAILHIPLLAAFGASRVAQLRDPAFELRPTRPTHTMLHWLVMAVYGVLFPAFYLLSVRTRDVIGPFALGPGTNSPVSVALLAAGLAWILAHLLEPALRLGAPRFDWGWLDRLLSVAGVGLCLWLHVATVAANLLPPPSDVMMRGEERFLAHWGIRIVALQSCLLGSTLLVVFAAIEAWRVPVARPSPRRRLALAVAVGATAAVTAPLWLSLPRTPHRDAVQAVATHRNQITVTALAADLDPRLVAGVVYAAQRERPRLTAGLRERLGIRLWHADLENGIAGELGQPVVNPRAGLCGMTPTQIVEALEAMRRVGIQGNVMMKLSSVTWSRGAWVMPWGRVLRRERQAQLARFAWALLRPRLEDSIKRVISGTAIEQIPLGGTYHYAGVDSMLSILLEPKNNLAAACAWLMILREQMRIDGAPVDDHPALLATAFHLGRPVPERAVDAFGQRAAEFMRSDECARLFDRRGEDR